MCSDKYILSKDTYMLALGNTSKRKIPKNLFFWEIMISLMSRIMRKKPNLRICMSITSGNILIKVCVIWLKTDI